VAAVRHTVAWGSIRSSREPPRDAAGE